MLSIFLHVWHGFFYHCTIETHRTLSPHPALKKCFLSFDSKWKAFKCCWQAQIIWIESRVYVLSLTDDKRVKKTSSGNFFRRLFAMFWNKEGLQACLFKKSSGLNSQCKQHNLESRFLTWEIFSLGWFEWSTSRQHSDANLIKKVLVNFPK